MGTQAVCRYGPAANALRTLVVNERILIVTGSRVRNTAKEKRGSGKPLPLFCRYGPATNALRTLVVNEHFLIVTGKLRRGDFQSPVGKGLRLYIGLRRTRTAFCRDFSVKKRTAHGPFSQRVEKASGAGAPKALLCTKHP